MIAEITAGLTATKHLKDLLSGAKDIADAAKINQVIIEAQEHLLTMQHSLFEAQQAVSTIAQEKAELERKVAEMEDWREEEKLYHPIHPKRGATVYALRDESVGAAQPSRMYCPNCFSKRQTSILQRHIVNSEQMKCFGCNFLVDISEDFNPYAIA